MADYPRPFGRYDGEDDEEEDDEEDAIPKIRIGVCAMSKKVYLTSPANVYLIILVMRPRLSEI